MKKEPARQHNFRKFGTPPYSNWASKEGEVSLEDQCAAFNNICKLLSFQLSKKPCLAEHQLTLLGQSQEFIYLSLCLG